jgi:phosphinothricin acetyltransferase
MANPNATIRAAELSDADTLTAIYNHYVLNTAVNFEENAISGAEMKQRMSAIRDASLPYLLAEADGRVVGFAYASPWKARSAYRFSVETTVYLTQASVGRGIGSILYGELIASLQNLNVHAVIGGISLPNEASIALHQKFGFEKVAHFQQVGFKFNQWIDVGYWQRILIE